MAAGFGKEMPESTDAIPDYDRVKEIQNHQTEKKLCM